MVLPVFFGIALAIILLIVIAIVFIPVIAFIFEFFGFLTNDFVLALLAFVTVTFLLIWLDSKLKIGIFKRLIK